MASANAGAGPWLHRCAPAVGSLACKWQTLPGRSLFAAPGWRQSRCEGADSLPSTLDLALAAAAAASDKQARDVVVLDVSEPLVICDYFVICSGSNDRQVRAIAEEVERACRAEGTRPLRREGEREAQWILLDFIDVVVHVFHQEEREYYDLERLWRDAPVVARSNELGSLVTA
jgi:ribosome-associated protein